MAMRKVEVVRAEVGHIYQLAGRLRANDEAEVRGLGHSPKRALYRGYRNSVLCRSALIDGRCAAMWGIGIGRVPGASLLGRVATPWLLTAADVEAVPHAYVRIGKTELAAMKALFPQLVGYVAADYAAAIRFLTMIGFTVDETCASGPAGGQYRRYHIGL